ncbi:darobactin export ABC transporter permease subunit [Sodalis sp. RH21]|uniref:darobactin export ABC transporter permease subunit n=1 Tax=unclassified Sodalis (in: enterobacteria) TaxID=2636512 RepID=UPI0039B48AE2
MPLDAFFNDIKSNPLAALLAIVITALGLVTTLLIVLLFMADYNTDRFYSEPQRMYRIETRFVLPNGDNIRSAQVPLPLIDALQKDARIDSVSYAFRLLADVRSQGRLMPRVAIFAVSQDFLARLNPYRQSPSPLGANEIYITPAFNRQYLGMASPKGQAVDLGRLGRFIIKDVLDPRQDSSLDLPAMIAFSPGRVAGYHDKRGDWYDTHLYAFIRTASAAPFDNRWLDKLVRNYAPQLPGAPFTPEQFIHLSAKNILAIHYDGGYADEVASVISKPLLHTLYGAALFVLLTTVVNFFNVNGIVNSAKKNSLRVKRSLGASNGQLLAEASSIIIPQFLSICALALLMLWGVAAVPGYPGTLLLGQDGGVVAAVFLGVALVIGCAVAASHLACLYWLVLSPRAGRAHNRHETTTAYYINRFTLVMQLLISGIMVYLWAGVMTQSHFIMDTDFGYRKKNLLTFEVSEQLNSTEALRGLQNRLKETAGSSNIALASWRPFDMSRSVLSIQHAQQQARDRYATVNVLSADHNFPQIWGLETLAGKENAIAVSNDPGVRHVIVTRAFMGLMGRSSYDDVLNTTFYTEVDGGKRALRVLRVVDNFYLGDRTKIPQPLMIFINDRMEKYAALTFPGQQQRERIVTALKDYGLEDQRMRTVTELYAGHFKNSLLMLDIIQLSVSLSLFLMLVSAIIIGLSEARRLNDTLKIMEAVGGSVYTSIVFFLRQNVIPLVVALLASFGLGLWLLRRWLGRYDVVAGLTYTYACCALIALALVVVAVMAMALLAGGGRRVPFRAGRG